MRSADEVRIVIGTGEGLCEEGSLFEFVIVVTGHTEIVLK